MAYEIITLQANAKDIAGQTFGRLTAIAPVERVERGQRYFIKWLCICVCGSDTSVLLSNLRAGSTQSCGCRNIDISTKHNVSREPEYFAWYDMINRCTNPSINSYKDYGGRGITVCDEWFDVENFIRDMGSRPSRSHSLDRIDNNSGYYPDNCRWATRKEQARNTRSNVLLTLNGKTLCLSEWSELIGVSRGTLYYRLRSGWSHKKTLSTPVDKRYSRY